MRAPVRGRRRFGVQCGLDDACLHLGRDRGCAARAWGVLAKCLDATLQEPPAPQRDLAAVQMNLSGNLLVLPALGSKQDHRGSLLQPSFLESGRRRQDARPGLAKMYTVLPARAWWPAVGDQLERWVRRPLQAPQ